MMKEVKDDISDALSRPLPHLGSSIPHYGHDFLRKDSSRYVTIGHRLERGFSVHFHSSLPMSAALRTSMRMASRPQQRLAGIQRQFSSSAPTRKEIRDAYIISASRTPTAVVSIHHVRAWTVD
jgi:hypothetical protein